MKIGDKVKKVGGDYRFDGVIVSSFPKLSGARRLVVEDDRGVLHIYSEKNLALAEQPLPEPVRDFLDSAAARETSAEALHGGGL